MLQDLLERYPAKPSCKLSIFCAGFHPSAISLPLLFGSHLRRCYNQNSSNKNNLCITYVVMRLTCPVITTITTGINESDDQLH